MIRLLQRPPVPPPQRPRAGLALGGGGSKGFAHIGAMKVLREAGVPIDVVAGTSIGSIIGALYAAGFDLDHIHEGMRGADRAIRRWRLSRHSLWSERGLLGLLEQAGAELRFEDLWLPFAAVATDLTDGSCSVLTQGPLWLAVLASCAMPGIFPPQQIDGHYLVDGGIACPVPAEAARNLGADVVIAIDLGDAVTGPPHAAWSRGRLPTVMGIWQRLREIQRLQIQRYALKAADVVIRPGIPGWRWRDFSVNADAYCRAGAEAAAGALESIHSLLSPAAGPIKAAV